MFRSGTVVRVLSRPLLSHSLLTRTQSSVAQAFQPFSAPVYIPEPYNAASIAMEKKRKYDAYIKKKFKSRKARKPDAFLPEGSGEEILEIEVADLLAKVSITNNNHTESQPAAESKLSSNSIKQPGDHLEPPAEIETEVELEIVGLSSTGDGLAYSKDKAHIFTVPFSVPGDRVLAKPWKWLGKYTTADFIKLIHPSESRGEVKPRCSYFSRCSGCQFQMLQYDQQLKLKQNIVERAFRNFSSLTPEQIPATEPTMPSPLQYGYRTKLSPHFSGPPRDANRNFRFTTVPNIGFNVKNTQRVMDIESCPIGADILQEGLKIERARVADKLQSYSTGATILLRESTKREVDPDLREKFETDQSLFNPLSQIPVSQGLDHDQSTGKPAITIRYPDYTDVKTYISDERAQAIEYITTTEDSTSNPPKTKTYRFTNTAGSFFQNNNSILGPFTSYIYAKCKPPVSTNTTSTNQSPIKYLLDAYSGSGLFTLTLSSHFTSSLGIDIDMRSIQAARANASANNVHNAGFIDADASALFADVPYPAEETAVVIDPPRKGCDREFLSQLRKYGPRRVIYVSCNVHSQARDVGILVNGFQKNEKTGWYGGADVRDGGEEVEADLKWEQVELWKYEIESLRGFDFFPQTGHVEGVCVLNRVERHV